MDNSQEMNHPSKIDPSPEAPLEFQEKANKLEGIVQSLAPPLPPSISPSFSPSSISPSFSSLPSFSPADSHEDVELRERVRELERELQRASVAAREAESRAVQAEKLFHTTLVNEARKDAVISALTRANDVLKRQKDDALKVVEDTRNARRELAVTNHGLEADNAVLFRKMTEGNDAKRDLMEEIDSLKHEMAEMKRMKRALTNENGALRQQLAEMGITSDRVAKWILENQDRKKPGHRGNSKKHHIPLTEEERYGNEQEVVLEGCNWKKVNGQWRVTVGEKGEETNDEDANVEYIDDDIDKMIEQTIKEKKDRIDAGIDEC